MLVRKQIRLIVSLLLIIAVYATTALAERSTLLRRMPTNSDQRCVGISAVAETLLQKSTAERRVGTYSTNNLAQLIFSGLSSKTPAIHHSHVEIKGERLSIDDPAALAALSTRVADLYKQETTAAWATPVGTTRLKSAYNGVLQTEQELLAILDADPDRTVLFCCFGARRFPDGTYRETHHAVLFAKDSDGEVIVFDPNDPGNPAPCKITENTTELTIEWSCRYRKTGFVTEQFYSVAHGKKFFQTARGLKATELKAPTPVR